MQLDRLQNICQDFNILHVLEDLKELSLTAGTRRDIVGILKTIFKLQCNLMGSLWSKILNATDERNIVIQARNNIRRTQVLAKKNTIVFSDFEIEDSASSTNVENDFKRNS